MTKFYGVVGYGEAVETPPESGVWVDQIVERKYYGDVIRNARSLAAGERLHDELTVSNSISIVADAYAHNHIFAIRYVSWSGALWTVSDVEVQSPRLILRLGGQYNGPTPA
ncbi:hypothetical protein SEA_RICKMORE_21 [Gordonia phage Rickmore]|uniref:DUF7253 domain-containing protein n=1 Tax=Gordonia phage Rickmore TaxID=2507854 RepID=A0A410TB53_9CAUD|nr:hypothetical protein HWC05_gp21 [Gordonia phage Rickmore]QAU06256.1 hypothetical protein SEA_RICKMORE_21 [Gordonia phage Rickmore]